MKRIRIIAALLLALSVCGCTVKEAGVAEGDSLPEIIIGSDNYEPYNYIDGDGNFSGVDVELARAAFEKMGYRPVFKQIVWENKDDYLKNGEVDCLWGCFTMTGRENKYIWAGPYLKSRQVVAVRTESDIKSISDLNERRVAVQASSIPEELLLKCETPDIPKAEWVYSFSGMGEVYASLRKGYADAICGHESALASFIATAPVEYRMLGDSLYISKLGVAFSKDYGDAGLAERLTKTLGELNESGTTAQILKKYGLDAGNVTEAE